jgi:hypothetical protein
VRHLLVMLVASLVLGLVGGVGPAWAGDLLSPSSQPGTSQTATQSNDGSNSASQSATSEPVVVSGPNVALANGSSCPCGGSGSTTQNSGNTVDASATNTATQSNNQSNAAGQTQTVSGGNSGSTEQSADQSNSGSNSADQSATSEPVVISGPNVAALNSGDVNQNSGNSVDASTSNNANQSNTQSNRAGQSQTVSGGGCCSSHKGTETSQSASQSNEGSNSADQTATSRPVVISGGNYAVLNKGDVNQNSGNTVDASSSNTANQSNNQSNSAGQSQTVAGSGRCCHKHGGDVSQSADQSNSGSNSADQSGYSAPVVVSGPNVAVANGWGHSACNPCGGSGGVNQNSGNTVWAPASNSATQSNTQSNALGQAQSVSGASSCCRKSGDVSQSADQSNEAENSANQRAYSAPVVVSGGNFAFFNKGGTTQNSGNVVYAPASNSATQTNNQSNSLGQTQSVQGGGCCPSSDCSSCHQGCESDCGSKCDRGCDHPCHSRCSKCEPKHDRCDHPSGCERG